MEKEQGVGGKDAEKERTRPVPEAQGRDIFLERLIGKFIDFLIMGAFFAFPTAIGPLAGTTYILISDGLKGGRSLGKRVTGLLVVAEETDSPCDLKKSIARNSPFAALIGWYFIVRWIPYLGPALAAIAWLAVTAIEIALIYSDEEGKRFGDRIAGTRVRGFEA